MGYVLAEQDGVEIAVRCGCQAKRLSMLRLKRSGISEELQKKGFNDFDCRGVGALEMAKNKAKGYYQHFLAAEGDRQNSIILCGQPGAGKTHLGMAICNNLLNVCGVEIAYMAYRNAMTAIKQAVTDKDGYYAAIGPYCNTRLLYIDDLLKGRQTEADLNILYELVNYRYMHKKPMVISTEKTPQELVEFDEAIGSRIVEMCRRYTVVLQGKELNYRLYS